MMEISDHLGKFPHVILNMGAAKGFQTWEKPVERDFFPILSVQKPSGCQKGTIRQVDQQNVHFSQNDTFKKVKWEPLTRGPHCIVEESCDLC